MKDRKLPLLAKTEEADATEKRELRREGCSEVVDSAGMGGGVGGGRWGCPVQGAPGGCWESCSLRRLGSLK